ncbi:MAG: DUF2237 domain-containing protein [Pseudomonadota bacterium]
MADVGAEQLNILGRPLEICGCAPMTGFARDGRCAHFETDPGGHLVCAVVTDAFLAFTKAKGNDLSTPRPEFDFPGLKDGDRWCLCAVRWREAMEAGVAPPVVLEATHAAALNIVSREDLLAHAAVGAAN